MKPFLTILVAVYNVKEQYLRACLESLIAQSMSEFKVIIIDDGSVDQSGIICDEYAVKDDRFSVIHQPNAGLAVVRNNGIALSDTEWITFVDGDDWIEKNYVSDLFKAKEKCTDAEIILFDYFQEYAAKTKEKTLGIETGVLNREWVSSLQIAPFNCFIINGKTYEYETNVVWNKMYRLSLIRDKGLRFDPRARKGQDVIFNAECFQLTKKYYYIKSSLYHYRNLEGSMTNKFNPKVRYYNEVAFENYQRIIEKYKLGDNYSDAYYARVLTRMYSCMRLYYFHKDNKKPKKAVYKEIGSVLRSEPYRTALKKIKFQNLTGIQKIFVYFLKKENFKILYSLVKARDIIRKINGIELIK